MALEIQGVAVEVQGAGGHFRALAQELRDLRALAIPEGLDVSKPQCLNKHGLQTITAGAIRMKIHTSLQQQQPPAPPKGAQKLGAACTMWFDGTVTTAHEDGSQLRHSLRRRHYTTFDPSTAPKLLP